MPDTRPSGPCLWTLLPSSAPSPCDRYKHACCSSEGHVYVLGGRGSGCLRDLWRYSVVRHEWTQLNCSGEAAPEELEEHSMVAYEGALYVFGGMLDSASTRSKSALWVFDMVKQKWIPSQGKSAALQKRTPSNRKGHSAVVLASAMLLYGGLVDMRGSSAEFWRLDFDTMVWSLLSDGQQNSSGPGPRHSHSAVLHQDSMYLYGGLKGLQEQRDFWRWSSASHGWSSLTTRSGPVRLVGHTAVAYKDRMLLFGGGLSQNSPNNCLWSFNFSTHTWGQMASLPGSSPPDKIHHCCTGLGPSYRSETGGPWPGCGQRTRVLTRPFKNRCFPAPLSFLGSQGAIELQTFSLDQSHGGRTTASEQEPTNRDKERNRSSLTFENKALKKTWSCTEDQLSEEREEEEQEEDISHQHLPDLLLVLGGRPCTLHGPLSVWQMTLSDS